MMDHKNHSPQIRGRGRSHRDKSPHLRSRGSSKSSEQSQYGKNGKAHRHPDLHFGDRNYAKSSSRRDKGRYATGRSRSPEYRRASVSDSEPRHRPRASPEWASERPLDVTYELKNGRSEAGSSRAHHRYHKPRSSSRHRSHSRARSRTSHQHHSRRSPSPRSKYTSKPLSQHKPDLALSGTDIPAETRHQPNFGRSGKLAAETNAVAGTAIVLKYHEPPEARLPPPSHDWRLFEFKDGSEASVVTLAARSCWLVGRESAVADLHVAHPSCSAQHAVLQFRYVERRNEYGERTGRVRLYILDLDSANGTCLNGERLEERRFIELRSGDVLRFGESTREYVILLA